MTNVQNVGNNRVNNEIKMIHSTKNNKIDPNNESFENEVNEMDQNNQLFENETNDNNPCCSSLLTPTTRHNEECFSNDDGISVDSEYFG